MVLRFIEICRSRFVPWSYKEMDNPFLIFVILLALTIAGLFDFVFTTM